MYTGLRKRRTFHQPAFVERALNEAFVVAFILLGLVIACVMLMEYGASP